MNHIKVGLDDMLYGVTHWAAHIWPIPDLISYAGVTRIWGLLFHAGSVQSGGMVAPTYNNVSTS